MQKVGKLEYKAGTKEEFLPGFDAGFPCISSLYAIPQGDAAPWHWHPAVELFYIERGCLEYTTPSQRRLFHTGSGGVLMPNVPHKTRGCQTVPGDTQLLHLFAPVLISGQPGSRIEEKYVLPLLTRTELLILDPSDSEHGPILELIRESFQLLSQTPGYELLLREMLSRIWLALAGLEQEHTSAAVARTSELIRQMMIYVHGNYSRKLSVEELARSVNISPRMCYKLFRKHLNVSPMEYVNSCRVQVASRMLAQTEESVTAIAAECGFHTGSYFTGVFQKLTGKTPREYRKALRQEETG